MILESLNSVEWETFPRVMRAEGNIDQPPLGAKASSGLRLVPSGLDVRGVPCPLGLGTGVQATKPITTNERVPDHFLTLRLQNLSFLLLIQTQKVTQVRERKERGLLVKGAIPEGVLAPNTWFVS